VIHEPKNTGSLGLVFFPFACEPDGGGKQLPVDISKEQAERSRPGSNGRPQIWERLKRLAGRADEIAKHGDVRTVCTDATGIDGQTETLGKIEINSGIVQFRKAEAGRWRHAI